MQTVYKIVRADEDGTLWSLVARGRASVIYRPGEWVFAPDWLAIRGYHLLAYRSITAAEPVARAGLDRGAQLWEAEATVIDAPLPWFLHPAYLDLGVITLEWNTNWPEETVMCQSIKLIRRIL